MMLMRVMQTEQISTNMACVNGLYIVSYNIRGFNQGIEVVNDLVNSDPPDIILLQEHWLTPVNLSLIVEKIQSHYSFRKSAMSDRLTQGPLVGRPFGGTSILIKNELRAATKCIFVLIATLLSGLEV